MDHDHGIALMRRANGSMIFRYWSGPSALSREYCRSEGVPLRARLLGLDRVGAEAAFKWRQRKTRRYQQAR